MIKLLIFVFAIFTNFFFASDSENAKRLRSPALKPVVTSQFVPGMFLDERAEEQAVEELDSMVSSQFCAFSLSPVLIEHKAKQEAKKKSHKKAKKEPRANNLIQATKKQ